MLKSIRDNIKGRAAKVVLAIIIIPFVFFGVGSLVETGGAGSVLEVNGEEVSQQEMLLEMQLVRAEILNQMGENADYSQITEDKLAPLALDRLTRKKLVDHTVAEMKMGVSNALVESIIIDTPVFQQDGQFSNALLDRFLVQQGMNLSMLKDRIANDIKERQVTAGVAFSNFALPFSTELLLKIFNERREIDWVKLPVADVTASIEATEVEIAAYYEANQADYMSELQISLDYIEMRIQDLYQPVSEEQIAAEYRIQADQFESAENRRVSHILLELSDAQTEEQARATLASVSVRVAAGEDFAELAREFSQDAGSAEAGGDLGYAQQDGTYPEAFESAIFALELNQVSEPIKTDAGLHLVKLTDIDLVEIDSLEDMREQIVSQVQMREAQASYVALIERAADIAFNAADLSEPAELLDLEVKSSAPISRTGSTVADAAALFNDSRVLDAAFSEEVLNERLNSEVIELAPDHAVLVQVAEVFEPRQLALEEIRDQIVPVILREKASLRLEGIKENIISASASGAVIANSKIESKVDSETSEAGRFAASAKQAGYSVTSDTLMRNSTAHDSEFVINVFEAPRREIGTDAVMEFESNAGDIYLYQLKSVSVGESGNEAQLTQLFSQQIQTLSGQQDALTFLESVEVNAEIERF